MAESNRQREPGSAAPRPALLLARIWDELIRGMNALGSLWILVLMLLIASDVIGRNLLKSPVRGVPEIVGLSIVGIVFIQLAYAVRNGKLTRSDAILTRLNRRTPRSGYALDAVIHLFGAFVFAIIVHASLPLLIRSWSSNDYAGVAGYFTVPTWPLKLIILVGSACAAVEFLRRAWRLLRLALEPGNGPTS